MGAVPARERGNLLEATEGGAPNFPSKRAGKIQRPEVRALESKGQTRHVGHERVGRHIWAELGGREVLSLCMAVTV